MATTEDLPPGVAFLTITDYGFFPGTVATVNSIFHPMKRTPDTEFSPASIIRITCRRPSIFARRRHRTAIS
jgi:hypothetical protein